jgi:hypothetical protein
MSEPASPPDQHRSDDSVEPVAGTDHQPAHAGADTGAGPVDVHTEPPQERVARGLAAAFVALLVGAGLTLAIWNFGFIASITSFVMAAGATFLYGLAAGAPPRRGVVPLVVLVVLGVVATFFLLVAWDAAQAYDELVLDIPDGQVAVGKGEFVRTAMFDGEVLKSYGKDMAFFFGFAVLGMWTTLKNVLGSASD